MKKLFANLEGKPKAIRLLTSATAAIRDGRIETLLGRSDSRIKQAAIYPVIVVPDASLEAPFVNAFLNDVFQNESPMLEVRSLTLMSVEELEETLPMISAGPITWDKLPAKVDPIVNTIFGWQ